jgi:hypothetical protein
VPVYLRSMLLPVLYKLDAAEELVVSLKKVAVNIKI